jgi:pyruvate,orthophosphate dikinase
MTWIFPLAEEVQETTEVLGGKAQGLITLRRLGLPVPPGFVITTGACRRYFQTGQLPDISGAIHELERTTGRSFNDSLVVAVRSGGAVSMPGMMDTILNVSQERQLTNAIRDVFESWNTPRAITYREINDIPHDNGTAVIVQAMVLGNRDERSGTGVAFSRNPHTGEPQPFGEVLFGHQGPDVVSGRTQTEPLHALAREPQVWTNLRNALTTVEQHYRDAAYLEFTFETGELWLLQARPGQFVGRAAIRVAVDLADEGAISKNEALERVTEQDLENIFRIATTDVVARGTGAAQGVATGRVATTSDAAVRMAADGPVILLRPETSPLDMHGLAAAQGVITQRGGPASHAAIVARSLGKPAVVGVGAVTIPEGTLVTIDGTGGEIVLGKAGTEPSANDPYRQRLLAWAEENP